MSLESNARIQRIINNIQVETHLAGHFKTMKLEERMKQLNSPGVSITVVNDSKIEWSMGFGVKNLSTKEKVDADTMFLAGSVSKPVFALAVMKLVEKGLIDLDRDVNDCLKSWKIPKNGNWQPKVSMRQLLGHTAGLTVHGFAGYSQSKSIPSTKQILNGEAPANSSPVVVNILPGTMMRYSGGGTTVAQLVVEEFLGSPLSEIIDDILFKPLNINNSTYRQNLTEKQKKQIAFGYPFFNQQVESGYHIYPEMAAAGLWTNGNDLAKIMIEIQNAINSKPSFFAKETIEQMLSPQQVAKNMGIGFFLEGADDAERFYHGGWDEGFVTKFVSYKKGGNGAIVFINSNEGVNLLDEIIRAIAIEYNWNSFIPKADISIDFDHVLTDEYCGFYDTETGLIFNIVKSDNGLKLEVSGQMPINLSPKSKEVFSIDILNTKIKFDFDMNNKVQNIIVTQDENAVVAKKRR